MWLLRLEIREIDASLKDLNSPSEELFQLLFVSKYPIVHVLLFGVEGGRAMEMAPREGEGEITSEILMVSAPATEMRLNNSEEA
ncbi:hypothetical protein ACOSP7_028714 [Xanthoceras sorbifolium]